MEQTIDRVLRDDVCKDVTPIIASYTSAVWSVVFTYYVDDYKPRGGDWSTSTCPKLFATKRKACTYLRQELLTQLHRDTTDTYGLETLRMEGDRYYFDEDGFLLRKHQKDLELIQRLVKQIKKGEYCSRRMSWVVEEIEFADEEVISSDEEEHDDEQEEIQPAPEQHGKSNVVVGANQSVSKKRNLEAMFAAASAFALLTPSRN